MLYGTKGQTARALKPTGDDAGPTQARGAPAPNSQCGMWSGRVMMPAMSMNQGETGVKAGQHHLIQVGTYLGNYESSEDGQQ
jgi:hypothetical protein